MKKHKFKKYFFKKIKLFIKKSKSITSSFFRNEFLMRVVVLAFFLGLNIVLGSYFVENNDFHLPEKITDVLDSAGLVKKEKLSYLGEEILKENSLGLDPQVILEKLNEERAIFEVSELEYSEPLASAAGMLLSDLEKYDFDLEDKDFLDELKKALNEVNYEYSHVSHNIVIGPSLEQAVVDAWFSDEQQIKSMQDDDFIEVGFATKIVELDEIGTVGVVVQILGRPMEKGEVIPQQTISSVPVFPDISDQEVIEALNRYRKSHKVRTLNLDDNLCEYASKRVDDLIAFGSLDDHAGFKKDFEDQENLPQPIKDYSGNAIAENLAYQYCKNMTTGDSFIAETGTSIIEWCFDSSTKGHREAQLNNDYENVCVRHGEGMYVVIFGN